MTNSKAAMDFRQAEHTPGMPNNLEQNKNTLDLSYFQQAWRFNFYFILCRNPSLFN